MIPARKNGKTFLLFHRAGLTGVRGTPVSVTSRRLATWERLRRSAGSARYAPDKRRSPFVPAAANSRPLRPHKGGREPQPPCKCAPCGARMVVRCGGGRPQRSCGRGRVRNLAVIYAKRAKGDDFMVTHEDVLGIAMLSKLYIPDDELDKMTKEMDDIIRFADTINNASEEDTEFDNINNLSNAFREDEVVPSRSREDILSNANDVGEGHFLVRKRM